MTSQQYQMSLFEESDVWTLSVEDFRDSQCHCCNRKRIEIKGENSGRE